MLSRLKTRMEGLGLAVSLIGLAAILQPFNLAVYTYGFYILVLGAAVTFFSSTIPEESGEKRALIQILVLTVFVSIVLFLAVYLAPQLLF